jgi:tRNA pseudouridine65 synthase
MQNKVLEIMYRDEHLVAINKPHGLLVHKSPIACDAKVFAVQELRNQLGQHVYPCHRLDRKTGGVLLFSLSEKVNALMQQQFANNQVSKTYHAIVRGFAPNEGTINYALLSEKGNVQEAITHFKTLSTIEIPIASGKFATSRYSLVEAKPQTGRMHQLRKHFAHIFHPIIGDRPHGCNKQNRMFKQNWGMDTMLLHAKCIEFTHPVTKEKMHIEAPYLKPFEEGKQLIWEKFKKTGTL